MTNGEKIQKDFKGCEVCEPIVEDDIIHVIFADKKDSAIGFDWSWWNAEYKEPTTKNDKVDCEHTDCNNCVNHKYCDYESTTKNDLPHCQHTDEEIAKSFIEDVEAVKDQLPTTKNDLGVDCISRESIKQKLQEHHDFFVNAYGGFSNLPQNDKSRVDEIINCIAMVVNEPSVTPQEPKTGQYEKHTDHTDCIWYGSDSGCPVTCSQYRDGWNDAMDYIFKNGKGYQPYRHDG